MVAGVCFAETGHSVTCVDVNTDIIDRLNQGLVTIYEPGLSELLSNNLRAGRIRFTTSLREAMPGTSVIFIAVGTPMGEDGGADLKHVLGVAKEIGQNLQNYVVVVNKSTVPVGTADEVRKTLASCTSQNFDVVSNPEFLKEGAAIQDFLHPDRIVIGFDSERANALMQKLYAPFVRTGAPIIGMDIRSAEMTKYVANAMLATKISFINEMSRICDAVGANINIVRNAVGADKRIGSSFLFPGVGFGGSCFPKDVRALERTGRQNNLDMSMMRAVMEVNESQKLYLFKKISRVFSGSLRGKRFAVWGLAFKPKTDDMREAPSLTIISSLLAQGASIKAYDPQAMQVTRQHYLKDSIEYAKNPYDALDGADALILLTEWTEFRTLDFDLLKKLMKGRLIFDGRNIYSREEVLQQGFDYHGIGC